ncbi:MAG TPA: LacI family DNA-binding transcriptional regulator [Pseudonocardia sp.]|nr:LacI family DNA-binding transcriptional regulator [Pseudonocardia sp.]
MTTNIAKVAELAGVSTATVSRALRGLPHVSESTRARVVEAARTLSYSASPSASTLRSGRTRAIGIVVPFVDRWFFGRVVSGADPVLRANEFDLLLYHLGDDRGRRRFFTELPLRRRVDGLLVLSLNITAEEAAALASLDVPVALVGAECDRFTGVRIDDVESAAKAVRYLIHLGHRDIALISGGREVPLGFLTPLLRRSAYVEVLRSAGIEPSPDLEADGGFTVAGGERAMSELLAARRRPTAVFCESDEMAFGALRTLRKAGLRVPEDVSVIGFDDHEVAEALDLTTVAQPIREQGELAARIILSRLGREQATVPSTVLPTRLVIRGSTGPAPTDRERAEAGAVPAGA